MFLAYISSELQKEAQRDEKPRRKKLPMLTKLWDSQVLLNFALAFVLFVFISDFFVFTVNVNVYDNFHYTI